MNGDVRPRATTARFARSSAPERPVPATTSARWVRTLVRSAAVLATVAVLGAVFAAYLHPDMTLDLGALLALCGIR